MDTKTETIVLSLPELQHILLPLAIILAAFIIGLILNRIIFNHLKNITFETSAPFRELIFKSLRGIPVAWSLMAGIYLAVNFSVIPPRLLAIMQSIVLVLILLSATVVCARIVVGLIKINAQKAEGIIPSSSILVNIAEFSIYALGLMIILQSLGVSVTPILTALGVGGLAVALALQDTLANFIAGIHILLAKRIAPGDYIRLSSGEEGYITDINWRDTTLKGLNNILVIVPNSKISSAIVTNYALPDKEVSISVPVMVSYASDLLHVEKVVIEVGSSIMKEVPGGVLDFEPLVRFTEFGDSNINFNVILRGKDFIYTAPIKHEFIKKLYSRFAEEGIDISYPVRVVHNK